MPSLEPKFEEGQEKFHCLNLNIEKQGRYEKDVVKKSS